jgi:uncharacterized membrane protein HdeD (DUF308 family)
MDGNNNFITQYENPMANPAFLAQLKKNWGWYLALGVGLALLGTLAVLFAFSSTMLSVIYLGVFLVGFGIFEAIKAFKVDKWQGFFLHLFLGILYTVGGIFMIWHPIANAVSLTLLLAVFFVIAGITRIAVALMYNMPHKGWLILNGAVTLLLGGLIWYQWPVAGLWVIGTLLGIEMIFTGWTWIMLSLMSKKIEPTRILNR